MIRGRIIRGIAGLTTAMAMIVTAVQPTFGLEFPSEIKDEVIRDEQGVEEAEKAFDDILADKDVMALVYLTDECSVYDRPDFSDEDGHIGEAANVTAVLTSGYTVYIKGVKLSDNESGLHNPIYLVSFYEDGEERSGYIEGRYLAYSDEDWIAWEKEYLSTYKDDEVCVDTVGDEGSEYPDIAAFPESYRNKLTDLKNAHPEWKFVALKTGLDFNASVSKEMGDKSWISITDGNKSKGWVGDNATQAGWAYATRSAVVYHMDPRNFLTESYIFQFEQLTFNSSYHDVQAVQKFLDNTFMKGMIPDDTLTYAEAFYNIGSSRKISPVHLASRVYQEQGKGTSPLISGTYKGYEGYYNYFNVGATGSGTKNIIENGLKYARDKGWNTRYKALEGGAATIGNNYILKGQDTSYLEKFNVAPGAKNATYTHQYMQNIQAPSSEALSSKKMYVNAGCLDSPFVFKIPVYNNMEEQPAPAISISKAIVSGLEARTYTGSEADVKCVPVVSLADGTVLKGIEKDSYNGLTEKEAKEYDYTYIYSNIDKAGTAKVKITGVNGYTGTLTKSYKINPAVLKELYEDDPEGFCIRYYSSFDALMHGLKVQNNGIGLPEDEVTAAGVKVNTVRTLEEIEDIYLRGGSRPQIILYFAGVQLDKKSYSVSFKNYSTVTSDDIKESRLPVITVTGKGNLKGSIKGIYKIADGDFANEDKVVVTAADKKFANRKNAWKSNVRVTDIDKKTLRAGTDYDRKIVYTYACEPVVTDKKGNEVIRNMGDEVDANDIPAAGTVIRVTVTSKGAYDCNGEHILRSVTYMITD